MNAFMTIVIATAVTFITVAAVRNVFQLVTRKGLVTTVGTFTGTAWAIDEEGELMMAIIAALSVAPLLITFMGIFALAPTTFAVWFLWCELVETNNRALFTELSEDGISGLTPAIEKAKELWISVKTTADNFVVSPFGRMTKAGVALTTIAISAWAFIEKMVPIQNSIEGKGLEVLLALVAVVCLKEVLIKGVKGIVEAFTGNTTKTFAAWVARDLGVALATITIAMMSGAMTASVITGIILFVRKRWSK